MKTTSQRFYERHREQRKNEVAEYARRRRRAVLEILGNKCVRCGFNDLRALQIDHVNGGGMKELRNSKATGTLYLNMVLKSFLNNEKKYQLLCANCNWIKRSENGETAGRPKAVLKEEKN